MPVKQQVKTLSLKPSSKLEPLVNQFNNGTPENGNDPEKFASSKYYNIDEMHNTEIPHKSKSLSLFHISVCSLNKNFDQLHPKKIDATAISKTRITKNLY